MKTAEHRVRKGPEGGTVTSSKHMANVTSTSLRTVTPRTVTTQYGTVTSAELAVTSELPGPKRGSVSPERSRRRRRRRSSDGSGESEGGAGGRSETRAGGRAAGARGMRAAARAAETEAEDRVAATSKIAELTQVR